MTSAPLPITGEPAADELLAGDPLALILGMLLDQQIPMERAFVAPFRLRERLGGGELDAHRIATMPIDELGAVFRQPPALHRYWGSMSKRTQAFCQALVEEYDGDAAAIWTGVTSGAELVKRLQALPGFGQEKSKIFAALLAKRFGIRPEGWEKATSPFSDDEPRSAADVHDSVSFERVREWKKAMRAAGKAKSDKP
jgi:uncharacterized HhH-GPD family protein